MVWHALLLWGGDFVSDYGEPPVELHCVCVYHFAVELKRKLHSQLHITRGVSYARGNVAGERYLRFAGTRGPDYGDQRWAFIHCGSWAGEDASQNVHGLSDRHRRIFPSATK